MSIAKEIPKQNIPYQGKEFINLAIGFKQSITLLQSIHNTITLRRESGELKQVHSLIMQEIIHIADGLKERGLEQMVQGKIIYIQQHKQPIDTNWQKLRTEWENKKDSKPVRGADIKKYIILMYNGKHRNSI